MTKQTDSKLKTAVENFFKSCIRHLFGFAPKIVFFSFSLYVFFLAETCAQQQHQNVVCVKEIVSSLHIYTACTML